MRNRRRIAALTVFIIALSACGGSDSPVVVELQPTTTTTTTTTTTSEAPASQFSDGYAPTLDGAVSYLEDLTRANSELDSTWLPERQWSGCPEVNERELASALVEGRRLFEEVLFPFIEWSAWMEARELVVTGFNEEALTITVETRLADDASESIRYQILQGRLRVGEVTTYAWEEGSWASTKVSDCLDPPPLVLGKP